MNNPSNKRSRPVSRSCVRVGTAPADLSALFVREGDIPPKFRLERPLEHNRVIRGGGLSPWTGRATEIFSPIEIRTPSGLSPKRIGSRPEMTGRDALGILAAARMAFADGRGAWPSLPLDRRIRCLEDFAGRLAALKEPIVRTLMWEIAKPYAELEDECDRTIESIARLSRIAETRERASRSLKRGKGIIGLIRDEPLGVALCAGPYNYPLFETLGLVIPALLAGNVVIIKPPRFGVLFLDFLLEPFASCFPPGTIQVLSGDGPTVLDPLMKSGGIDVFAFIGSLAVADRLIHLHPKKTRLRSLLGLGAKNAAVILPDADLDTAVRECLLGALAFNGQRCAALKILFVHDDVGTSFVDRLVAETAELGIGMPWTGGVRITPLADPDRGPYLRTLMDEAMARGAEIVNENGGRAARSILCPAILRPVTARMKLFWEEQFGPLIPVAFFKQTSEPVDYLRKSPFGQQASLFGTNPRTLGPLIEAAGSQVARININAKCQRGPDVFPFTGKKDSARGDFSASEILGTFSDRTVVAARDNELSAELLKHLKKRASSSPDRSA